MNPSLVDIAKLLIDSGKVQDREQLEKALEIAKRYGENFYLNIISVIQPLLWQDEGECPIKTNYMLILLC